MATPPTFITRFAPSPTGLLHLGHAYAAKCAFDAAKVAGGTCILRIEDIDMTRCKPEYHAAILQDLEWLGFDWPNPVRLQSQHRADYDSVIETLKARGVIYRCFKTRKDLPQGLYRGQALPQDEERERLEAKHPYAWRLSTKKCEEIFSEPLAYEETGVKPGIKTVNFNTLGDDVVSRKDIGTSYHVACCHDDALQNVTHIIRGMDIEPLTPFHRLLQALMGWPTPVYHHHPLLKASNGEKLAKRNKNTSIRSLREQGFTVAQLLDMATP